MRAGVALLGLGALACVRGPIDELGVVRDGLVSSTTYRLTNTNVAELRSIDFAATQTIQDGNLVLSICLQHNSILNAALGIDVFLYGAVAPPYGILTVNEAGWSTNFDGTEADGFGSFASRKSANPAGGGGISCAAPLIITLHGDPTSGTNVPLELALHVRFDGDCSGWVSNRALGTTAVSIASCWRKPDCCPVGASAMFRR